MWFSPIDVCSIADHKIVKHRLEIYFDWASFYKFTDFGEYLF